MTLVRKITTNFLIEPVVEVYPEDFSLEKDILKEAQKQAAQLKKIISLETFYRVSEIKGVKLELLCDLLTREYQEQPGAGIVLIGGYVFLKKNRYLFGLRGGTPFFNFVNEWIKILEKYPQKSKFEFYTGNEDGFKVGFEGNLVTIMTLQQNQFVAIFNTKEFIEQLSLAKSKYEAFRARLVTRLKERLRGKLSDNLIIHSL